MDSIKHDLTEKERKTEAGVDGQHQARLDREGIITRSNTIMGCLEAISPKHRPNVKDGKHYDVIIMDKYYRNL